MPKSSRGSDHSKSHMGPKAGGSLKRSNCMGGGEDGRLSRRTIHERVSCVDRERKSKGRKRGQTLEKVG